MQYMSLEGMHWILISHTLYPFQCSDGYTLLTLRDVLHSLNADTGEINWKVDFVERYDTPLPAFGMVCSPLINGDGLYVQAGSGFVKLDKRNGKSIGRSLQDKGGMFGSAFSSPVIEEINGKPQVVVQTRTDLAAVNPKNGKELWKQPIKAFRGMNILTPTVIGNSIFTNEQWILRSQFSIYGIGSHLTTRVTYV